MGLIMVILRNPGVHIQTENHMSMFPMGRTDTVQMKMLHWINLYIKRAYRKIIFKNDRKIITICRFLMRNDRVTEFVNTPELVTKL